ncbi:hypothetical protein PM082_022963 [Marasmius tenuissimus]|nr:hypothetical protein PM082_022963 [Marasmius tenuissimus]
MPSSKSTTAGTIRLPPSLSRKNMKGDINVDAAGDAGSAATTDPGKRKGRKRAGVPKEQVTIAPKAKKPRQDNGDRATEDSNHNQLLELTNTTLNSDADDVAMVDIDKEIARLLELKNNARQLIAMKNKSLQDTAKKGTSKLANTSTDQNTPVPVLPTPRKTPAPKKSTARVANPTNPATPSRSTAISKQAAPAASSQEIEKIPKPEGVPGLKVENGGFNVQSAAKVDNKEEWNHFINIVHGAAERADINFDLTFKQQDPEARLRVYRRVAKRLPYFCKERFANYWVTEIILQQYINNRRKHARNPRNQQTNNSNNTATDASGNEADQDASNEGEENQDEGEEDGKADGREDGVDEDEDEESDMD